MALACKKLTGLLLLPAQGSDVSTREARASESASSTRIDALEILASSWAEVSLPRKNCRWRSERNHFMTTVGTTSSWPESKQNHLTDVQW